jgi:hypothetical protein
LIRYTVLPLVALSDESLVPSRRFVTSSVISGDQRVERLRKRPKETSSKAKTIRIPFGKATKVLSIPAIADGYNYYIGTVDEFDHLTGQNAGLQYVERGGYQALEY